MDKSSFTTNIESPQILDVYQILDGCINRYELLDWLDVASAISLKEEDIALIKEISTLTADIQRMVNEMIEARKVANRITEERAKAIAYHDTVADYLEEIRTRIDKLELVIDDQMWTLPKYRELLFLR